MKKILGLVLVGLFFAVGSAQAHCGKCGVGDEMKSDAGMTSEEKSGTMADKMAASLKLSDEQKSQVQAILEEKMAKKKAIREEKLKAMDALHEEFKSKLSAVLTPEQMASWEGMHKEKGEMKGKCPMCGKEGKACEHCKKNMDCPMCQKEGKMCDMCKMKKAGKEKAEGTMKQEGDEKKK